MDGGHAARADLSFDAMAVGECGGEVLDIRARSFGGH